MLFSKERAESYLRTPISRKAIPESEDAFPSNQASTAPDADSTSALGAEPGSGGHESGSPAAEEVAAIAAVAATVRGSLEFEDSSHTECETQPTGEGRGNTARTLGELILHITIITEILTVALKGTQMKFGA